MLFTSGAKDNVGRERRRLPRGGATGSFVAMSTFAIELESSGLLLEVRLNDVRVYRDFSGTPRIREDRVNHWIVPGENILEVWLGRVADCNDPESFELEWLYWGEGKTRKSADRISGYRYNRELILPIGETRRVWDSILKPEDDFGSWAWQDADEQPVSDADRAEIISVVESLYQGIAKKDILGVRKKLSIQNAEMARAYGVSPEDRDHKQKSFLEQCVAADRWRLEPLKPELFHYNSQAGGRLVFVTDPNGFPPVRGVSQSTTFDLPCGFSRVNGVWTVVR
ncbi:MAG: hypothetical protein ACKVS6_11585 [Planctomycetota bacterium]